MKLLYITNGITGSGGLERVLSVKASHLAEGLGYDVHILRLNEGEKVPFYAFSPKVTLHSIVVGGNAGRYLQSYIQGVQNIVDQLQPEVISVCDDGLKAFFLPLFLGRQRPIMYERHASVNLNFRKKRAGIIANFKNKISYWLMQRLASNFKAFVVLTQGNLKEWRSDNLKVIGNPLSFYPKESAKLNEKKVIVVGSHGYNKGFDLLLEAWVLVTHKYPEWELSIFGKIDTQRTYINYAKKLQVTETVSFSEPVENIQNKYLNSSILVLPSRSEGFGMVLIEAMACGVPCISFDCPHGPADIISDGEDGLLVKNGDVKALASAIIDLIENFDKRIALGSRAQFSAEKYLPKKIVKQWDGLFQSLIE